jgi:hypothetical protein
MKIKKPSVAVACYLPGRAKDLSAPRVYKNSAESCFNCERDCSRLSFYKYGSLLSPCLVPTDSELGAVITQALLQAAEMCTYLIGYLEFCLHCIDMLFFVYYLQYIIPGNSLYQTKMTSM